MQDIHSLTGGGTPTEHLFAVAAAGDRRLLRQTNQALKCPRCDSLNTKFCYYNNYNLSQPRHFCKSCRRYWTKGGVLRNVPVGGGCRKSKRSSSSSSSSNSKSSLSKPPPSPSLSAAKSQPRDDATVAVTYNNINNLSGDSSVIAAAAIPADIPTLFHEYSASCVEKPATTTASSLYGFEDISIDHHHGVERDDVSPGMLTEIGDFPILIGSTAEIAPFGYGGLMSQHDHHHHHHHQPQDRIVVEGFGPLDWEEGSGGDSNGGDRGEKLFDITGAVDHAYWSQQNQWTATVDVVDHHQQQQGGGGLFLP